MRRNPRRLVIAATSVAAVVGAVGVLHMPFARGLLMRAGGCPMAGAHMTAVEGEHARHMALAAVNAASETPAAAAPARPALGFTLDVTTLADVHAWASREHVDCGDAHPGFVKCTAVRPAALGLPAIDGAVDELTMAFNVQDRLVNLASYRTNLEAGAAADSARTIVAALADKLGPASKQAGTFDAAHLRLDPMKSVAVVQYRYSDYVADVTAMNAPSGGPSIREHYMSARD